MILNKSISELWSNFDNCIQFEHLQQHKTYIDPIVKDCKEKVEIFTQDLHDTRLIIRRFDEVILNKSSKFEVDNLRTELNDFLKNVDFEKYK